MGIKRQNFSFKQLILLAIFSFVGITSYAHGKTNGQNGENYQSVKQLKTLAETYLRQEIDVRQDYTVTIKSGYLDPRLRLKACPPGQLTPFIPHGTPALRTRTVGVRCLSTQHPWSLYVPVNITVTTPVIVTTRPLPHGHRIKKADLTRKPLPLRQLKRGYFTKLKPILGSFLKRPLMTGAAIAPQDLRKPKTISKGEIVNIVAKGPGLLVSMQGIALMDGRMGETIRVQNMSSKKIIETRIIGNKSVLAL